MNIFNLPEDIFPDKNGTDTIIIHDYLAPAGFFSGKSVLHKNAVSLVISGRKTMHFAEKMVHIEADEFHFLSSGNCLVSMKLSDRNEFRSILIFFSHFLFVITWTYILIIRAAHIVMDLNLKAFFLCSLLFLCVTVYGVIQNFVS